MKLFPTFGILALFISSLQSASQTPDSTRRLIKTSITGFVNAEAIFDTRQVIEAREGYLALFPKNIENDKNGEDINAWGSFNQYAMKARLTVKSTGPDVLKARTSALIEGDFTGASNLENNSFRLRHAYVKMGWERISLIAGQYWHPFDVPEMIPEVLSLNTGAPFHSFSRQPQVRIDYQIGRGNLVFVASSQRDYVNSGPSVSHYTYLRNSGIPNLHLQFQLKNELCFAGAGFDYKVLVPRLVSDSNFKVKETVPSLAAIAFLKINFKPLSVKAQVSYGQNLNDHLLLGGYGVVSADPLTDERTYASLNYLNSWLNLSTSGRSVRYSLFIGYTKGYGANEKISGAIYAREPGIAYVYRIAPMITWDLGRVNMFWELEATTAAYGINDDYFNITVENTVTNFRNTLSILCNL